MSATISSARPIAPSSKPGAHVESPLPLRSTPVDVKFPEQFQGIFALTPSVYVLG